MKKNNNIKISVFILSLVIFLTTVFLYHLQVSAAGEFINPVSFTTGNDSLVSLDLNQDGNLDLISADDDGTRAGFSILFGNGDGTFDEEIFYSTTNDSDSLIGEDINNDNVIDIVVSTYNYTPALNRNLMIFIGNGDGTFTEGNTYNLASKNVEDFTAGDFNEDLNIDIIINNNILLGNGDGTFDEAIIYTAINESGVYSVKTYDFNKDNHLDIALINNSSAKVFILLGNGDGTFDEAVDYPIGTSPMNLALGDFNEDNNIDVAITNWSSVDVSILLGNGDGTFGSTASYEILNGQPHDIYINDLNKDGYLDLFISEGYSSVFAIFLGNGDGTFKIPEYYNTGSGASYNIVAEDFNNDDSIDVSLLHYIESDYKVSIFLNKNNLNEEEILKISDSVGYTSNLNLINSKTISSNSSYIVFTSLNGDTGDYGIYLYNKNNISVERISEIPEGGIGNEVLGAISNNGQYVVIASGGIDSEAESSISIYDHLSGTTKIITTNEQIPMLSILLMYGNLSVSNNGNVVISSNLNLSIMSLLMLTSGGELPPSPYLSAIYFYDNNSEEIITIDQLNDINLTSPYSGIISDNGEEIIYNTIKYIPNIEPGADPEIESHYFIYSISSEEIEEININLGLEYKNIYLGPSISSNERYISFWASVFSEEAGLSTEESLLVFYDRQLNQLETYSLFDYLNNTPILESDMGIFSNSIDMSEDGKYIILSFNSIIKFFGGKDEQENVYPLFIYDRIKNESVILDDGNSYMSANLSADGKYITFSSPDQLTEDDTDDLFDVFLMPNPLYQEEEEVEEPTRHIDGKRTGSSRILLVRFQQEQIRRAAEAGIENYVSDYCVNVPALQSEIPQGWVTNDKYECFFEKLPPEDTMVVFPKKEIPVVRTSPKIQTKPDTEENIEIIKEEPVEEETTTESEEVKDEKTKDERKNEKSFLNWLGTILGDSYTKIVNYLEDEIYNTFNNLLKGQPVKAIATIFTTIGVGLGIYFGLIKTLFINPISLSEITMIPIRLWNLTMIAFGFKKKTRPWGTVYDSVTKQPLDPVYMTVLDLNGNEVATCITDLDGRYGFLLPPGIYQIKAGKNNYQFPSNKLQRETSDIIYQDLYFGGNIEVKEGEVVTKNIPMDSLTFDWNEFAKRDKKLMKFFSKRELLVTRISDYLFKIGLIFSILMIFIFPSVYNKIVFAIYIILLILKNTILKPKLFGQVANKENIPIAFSILRFFRVGSEHEITHKVTDQNGKYYCLVPNGSYYAKIENKNMDESYSPIFTSEKIEVKRGYIDIKFKI